MARRTAAWTPAEAIQRRIDAAARTPTGSLRAQLAEEIHLPPEDPAEQAAARRLVLRLDPDHADELLDALGLAAPVEEKPDRTWLTTTQVAQSVGGVSSDRIRELAGKGAIRAARSRPGGPWLVHPAEVDRLAELVRTPRA